MVAGAKAFLVLGCLFLLQGAAARGQDTSTATVRDSTLRAARNGQVLRIWPLAGGSPANTRAYRILYRSTGLNGEPIPVTGSIIFAEAKRPTPRRVIAWAHPTTGVADKCAPSLLPWNFIQGLEEMLARDYVVVSTDYPGLGTPGMHPYLIGQSEARAVLDIVRAAGWIRDAYAGKRFAVWGHSQGGHAALFTGQIARTYAPDLRLVGVAAAAPATYLAKLFEADNQAGGGTDLTAMTLISWSQVYKLSLDDLVDSNQLSTVKKVAGDCIQTPSEFLQISRDAAPLASGFLKADPAKVSQWRSIMDRNTPGRARISAPVFIAQGTADTTVYPSITRSFVSRLCRQGTPVYFSEYSGVSHTFIGRDAAGEAIAWMSDRFSGRPPPSNCGM
jgi:acetyl esterase/lipase